MKRPRQHEIDTAAKRLFISNLPDNWVEREQGSDYGIDYEIEIFEKKETTGLIFKVQLKGTTNLKIIERGTIISFSIPVKNLKYYIEEINIPVVLIICDVINKNIYWVEIQSNLNILESYKNIRNNQNNLTIHIPINNTFPYSKFELLLKINECFQKIMLKMLLKMNPMTFADISTRFFKPEDLIEASRKKEEALFVKHFNDLLEKKEINTLFEKTNEIINNPKSSVEIKVTALLYQEKVIRDNVSDQRCFQYFFAISSKLIEITQNGPYHLKLFSIIYHHSLILKNLVNKEFTMYLNTRVHEEDKDNDLDNLYWKNILMFERNILSKKIIKKIIHLQKLSNLSIIKKHYHIFPRLTAIIIHSCSTFICRLDQEGIPFVDELRNKLETNLDIAIKISGIYKNHDDYILCSSQKALIYSSGNIDSFVKKVEEVRNLLNVLPKNEQKIFAINQLNELEKSMIESRKISQEEQITFFDIEKQKDLYRNMAKTFGINLDDEKDEIANIIRIGIDDLNPERILKNCIHLFVKLGSCGLPAKWLKLPTAGFKYLHCVKTNNTIYGLSLDGLYKIFSENYCKNCKYKLKHPPEWKWTYKWQQEQHEKYADSVPTI